jgi:hypothetical protein
MPQQCDSAHRITLPLSSRLRLSALHISHSHTTQRRIKVGIKSSDVASINPRKELTLDTPRRNDVLVIDVRIKDIREADNKAPGLVEKIAYLDRYRKRRINELSTNRIRRCGSENCP